MTEFKDVTEQIAKESVKKFLKDNNFRLGVETPHLVFNYLDYILWAKRNDADFKSRILRRLLLNLEILSNIGIRNIRQTNHSQNGTIPIHWEDK